MKTKYEGIINYIARAIVSGDMERARRQFRRAMKRYDDMTPVEQEVMDAHRYRLYGRRFEGFTYSAGANYWEGRILARQEWADLD